MTTPFTAAIKQDLWIVIAAHNEGAALKQVIESLLSNAYRNIVVVDDGSSDNTAEIALHSGAITIVHPINLGQGAALQTGIDFAVSRNASHIVTFDADGQHDLNDISTGMESLCNSSVEIALGSRFKGKTINMNKSKWVTLKLAVIFERITTGLKISDTHNGFRILTNKAARIIRIRQNRMAHASEILQQISKDSIPWIEIPVTIRYTEYSLSKGQRISNSINILKDLFIRSMHK